jgi:hypothetical protein
MPDGKVPQSCQLVPLSGLNPTSYTDGLGSPLHRISGPLALALSIPQWPLMLIFKLISRPSRVSPLAPGQQAGPRGWNPTAQMLCDVRGRDTGSAVEMAAAAVCHGERESPHGYLAAYADILSAGLYPHFFRIGFVLVNSQFSLDRGYNVVLPFADSRPPKPSGDGILAYPVVRPFIL